MDRFDVLDIIKVLDNVGSKKRYSPLSLDELLMVWKEISCYLEEQLLQNRSMTVPQLGTFYILKGNSKCTNFIPHHAWEKIPGYKIEKTIQQGSVPAECLRFTAIAGKYNRSRDDVETGLKDIIYALTKVLKRGSVAALTIGNVGKLYFQNNTIKMRYSSSFLKRITIDRHNVQDSTFQKDVDKKDLFQTDTASDPVKSVPKKIHDSTFASTPNLQVDKDVCKKAESDDTKNTILENIKDPQDKVEEVTHKATQVPSIKEQEVRKDFDIEPIILEPDNYKEESGSLEELKKLVENTLGMTNTHTHHYTGDRQWNDQKCPICRVKAQKVVFETQEQIFKKEKLNDKAIMALALEMDKELIKKAKDLEKKRHDTEIANSQFNYQNFLDNEQKKKAEIKNLPMGNLFEHRRKTLPNEHHLHQQRQDMADYLHQQMEVKHEKAKKEKIERDQEKIQMRERISTELKQSEIDRNMKKLVQWNEQREALAEQIRVKKEMEQEQPESTYDNPYARSENLMALYKKEKAKQLYMEQIEIMKKKKEYEARIAELDRKHSLERVVATRKGLERDLKAIKIAKYQQRKSLEEYWKQQIALK